MATKTDNLDRQTIVAAATAEVRSGVAVVRLSGEKSLDIAKKISGRTAFLPRTAEFCVVDTGEVRDEALVIFFQKPRSYTGEDIAEIHCHGNPLIVSEIIKFCIKNGARMAECGEFTKRAYQNGKSDLTAAEAVADIIAAETKLQLDSATGLREGRLFAEIEGLQSEIYDLLAQLNAAIDYPEEDIEETAVAAAAKRAGELAARLKVLAATFETGRLIKEGVRVAIYGAPNVGKSSILNRLLNKDRAIVSEFAGTTRDTIEDKYEYGGMIFVIVDTAGVRKNAGDIEQLGIERAYKAVSDCDIVLAVSDESGEWIRPETDKPIIYVKNKIDLHAGKTAKSNQEIPSFADGIAGIGEQKDRSSTAKVLPKKSEIIEVSALNGTNIDKIKKALYDKACNAAVGGFVLTNLRHFEAVSAAADFLDAASLLESDENPEIISIDLIDASSELGKITGLIGSDEIIARIFSKFCVGK